MSSPASGINELIAQVRAAVAADLHYLALFTALAIPDICGALNSDNGRASGPKYKEWLRRYVPKQAEDADDIYGLRCSLLHQGRAMPHGGVFPVGFTFPPFELHRLSTEVDGQRVGWISIPAFVDEVTRGAEAWLKEFGETQTVGRNLEKFARLRPEGLPPHVDRPVIA